MNLEKELEVINESVALMKKASEQFRVASELIRRLRNDVEWHKKKNALMIEELKLIYGDTLIDEIEAKAEINTDNEMEEKNES